MSGPRRHCTGAILAGGRAVRFDGAAKGLERVGGERIIDRVAQALRDACDDLVLVANSADAITWLPGVPVIPDRRPGVGALGGVHAALSHARDAIAVLPWDAPFVPASLIRALRATGEADDADAVLPTGGNGSRWGAEPLCAWYGPRCRAAIERHLDAGDNRAGAWQDAMRLIRVDAAPWGDPDVLFFNVNTPDNLARAQQIVAAQLAT